MTTVIEPQTQGTETKRMLPSDYLMQGWCQGRLQVGKQVCVIGAFDKFFGTQPWDEKTLQVLQRAIPKPYSTLSVWNDAPERIQEEVVQLALKVEYELGLR